MDQNIRYFCTPQNNVGELLQTLNKYEVISFDIFDTAIFRKLMDPLDVFEVLAMEMDFPDFKRARKKAEMEMRERKESETGVREVSLNEIYDLLNTKYNIDKSWMEKEIQLEYQMAIANPDMLRVYKELISKEKTIVFTTDMYLPMEVIENLLKTNGYDKYDRILLSNVENARKGDGGLQIELKRLYEGKKIIHIGDNYDADVKMSERAGISAFYYPREELNTNTDSKNVLFGSFYHSLMRNTIYDETWNHSLQYEHGFRVAGVLTAGYAKYISKVAQNRKIDKILFCARDCDVLYRAFGELFPNHNIEYIEISRYAIMSVTNERYFDDFINRTVLKYATIYGRRKTIEEVLTESGFDYLVPYLEEADIDRFMFAAVVGSKTIESFLYDHIEIIKDNLEEDKHAANEYFENIIGDAKRILVVDIAWSGTCIDALKYFLQKTFPQKGLQVYGTLMCTSRAYPLKNNFENGAVSSYIYSPYHNSEYTEYMMSKQKTVQESDLRRMPLEYMFTSIKPSLIRYKRNESGNGNFVYSDIVPDNIEEIKDMQRGTLEFCRKLKEYMGELFYKIIGSPVVAFSPFLECLRNKEYCYKVYKNFMYDNATPPFSGQQNTIRFGELMIEQDGDLIKEPQVNESECGKKILFVTPELSYTGTPRSMLRMSMAAQYLEYKVTVWSMQSGPFIAEYRNRDIPVYIIKENQLHDADIEKEIQRFDMAVCNTIVTDKFAKVCEKYIPTVWFIREATNIPDFCRDNKERFNYLAECKNIYCVSEYAAIAISKFTNNEVKVLHNCVEDEVDMAVEYETGTSDKVKFVQFGTMEYRKGYDVLIAAYLSMPEEYQANSEMYFAGGFINSGMPFCSYIFSKIECCENIHYLGVIKGERNKIETLSQMDVVVVASRDESCSLVALEGAMLSKPLILTENVGAKYMIEGGNGHVVKTGDIEALKDAMMDMIDRKNILKDMGKKSRENYDKYASMPNHMKELKQLYSLSETRDSYEFLLSKAEVDSFDENAETVSKNQNMPKVILSMYASAKEIEYVYCCIESLLRQAYAVEKILLCLDKKDFKDIRIPQQLTNLVEANPVLEIIWSDNGLGICNRYLCAVKRYPESPIIIVNADIEYDSNLVKELVKSYMKHPDSISCVRAELIMFRKSGQLRAYKSWIHNYRVLKDIPSYQIMPVGFGGVLYPPGLFDIQGLSASIEEGDLLTDDFILKMYAVNKGIRTVLIISDLKSCEVKGTAKHVSDRRRRMLKMYDGYIDSVLKYMAQNKMEVCNVLKRIRQDRFADLKI